MANRNSYLRMLPSNIREPLRKMLNNDSVALSDTVVLNKAVTTGITLSAAMTTGVSLTGAMTSGITLSGAMTTGITLSGTITTGMTLSGTMTDGIKLTGTQTDGIEIAGTHTNGLNISGSVSKGIRMGSYGSRLDTAGATAEVCTIGAETDEDDYLIGYGSYIRTSGEDGYGFGASFLVEATNTTGTKTAQGMQCMAFLGTPGGTQAAVLKTMGGDTTAGMYAGWFKVGANSNCVAASGSRIAVLWIDSQCSGTISGEEYAMFITAGASKVDAVMGFETTSSGWTDFLYFDETSYDEDPVVSSGCNVSGAGASEAYLKVNLNGTAYGIPLIAI